MGTRYQERAVYAHKFNAEHVLPLGYRGLVAVFLPVGGVNPDLGVVAFNVHDIGLDQCYGLAVAGKCDGFGRLLEVFGQVAVKQVVSAGKEYEQQGQEYGVDYHVADYGTKILAVIIVWIFYAVYYSVADEYESPTALSLSMKSS